MILQCLFLFEPIVIKACADCHIQPYGVQRAEDILRSMERGDAHIFPNIKCYNTIVNAYASMGDYLSAERLLHHVLALSSSNISNPIFPDIFTFNTVSFFCAMAASLSSSIYLYI